MCGGFDVRNDSSASMQANASKTETETWNAQTYRVPCTVIKGLLLLNRGIMVVSYSQEKVLFKVDIDQLPSQIERSDLRSRLLRGICGLSTSLLHVNPCHKQCTGTGKLALVDRYADWTN